MLRLGAASECILPVFWAQEFQVSRGVHDLLHQAYLGALVGLKTLVFPDLISLFRIDFPKRMHYSPSVSAQVHATNT